MAMLRRDLFGLIRAEFNTVPPALVPKLDAWCERAGVPVDSADAPAPAPAPIPPIAAPAPGMVVEQGDDTYVPLFVHMASPTADRQVVIRMARSFSAYGPRYGQTNTKARIAEFIAQIANETGGFTHFQENLRYSAKRLTQVWPGRFPTIASALPYAWDPSDADAEDEALAERTYGARGGNERNGVNDGDGWKYRGRGALQLTFYDNYKLFGDLLGLPLVEQPQLAAEPAVSVVIALEFFKRGNVNAAIDRGDFRQARHITNGGYIGVDEVATLRAKALRFIG